MVLAKTFEVLLVAVYIDKGTRRRSKVVSYNQTSHLFCDCCKGRTFVILNFLEFIDVLAILFTSFGGSSDEPSVFGGWERDAFIGKAFFVGAWIVFNLFNGRWSCRSCLFALLYGDCSWSLPFYFVMLLIASLFGSGSSSGGFLFWRFTLLHNVFTTPTLTGWFRSLFLGIFGFYRPFKCPFATSADWHIVFFVLMCRHLMRLLGLFM
mmetsp:Transcript_21067/g.45651  ORF Transcript_21067/g.45651 Transcript_21067/m.45651 type:complete len:208 (-) Transcript_21067:1351-1974(-)